MISREFVTRIDPDSMYDRIYGFADQLLDGYNLPVHGDLSSIKVGQIKQIVVAGMGGSAIGGDILRSYLADSLGVPLFINRAYSLPHFVGRESLVIGSSYSGNTEETLAAFDEAGKRGAFRFVATTGGKLGEIAAAERLPHSILPGGLQPRAALGYSFGPLLRLLERLGLVEQQRSIVESAVSFLRQRAAQFALEAEDNSARALAGKLRERIAVVYAGTDFYDTTAIRFKGQICENSKHLAFANINPEFNHNEIVGYEYPSALVERLFVIFLTGSEDSHGVKNRFKIIDEILRERGVPTQFVAAEGPNRLAEIFSLVQFGDFVSYYLALLNETDPSPVKVINRLKAALEKMR